MPITETDLDLSTVATDDHRMLASEIEDYYAQDSVNKLHLSYHWERNHLFLDGQQWITRTRNGESGRQWEPITVHRANEYIPRPVTNYLFDAYQTLKSYLVQQRPRSVVEPNTQSFEDKQAAKIAEIVAECNWERLKEEQNYEYAAANALTYGTVFKKDYWDTTALQIAKIPRVEEQPITDPTTGAVIGYQEAEVRDPKTGEVVYEEIPLGDVNTEIVEPFRVALDPLASDLHNARWIMEYEIQPLHTVRELYDRDGDGFTGEAKDLKQDKNLSDSMRRFFELKTSSGIRGQSFLSYTGTGGVNEMIDNATILKTYYEAPSDKHPRGRKIVVASHKVLYAGESPYKGPDLGDWHPYSEYRWEIYPGRFWGRSPFDDAIEPQKRINSIDAATILTRKTMAIPQKLIPKGSGIKRNEWTGRPGQIIEYRPVEGKPEIVPPAGVDAQIFQERQQCVQDIKQITGAIDILKGERPPSVSAASALELLFEVGTGKLRPALDRWKFFIESSQKKQLKLISHKYKEPRPDFITLMASRLQDMPASAIDSFVGADLRDNCNVKIEAGSNVPKLLSAQRSRILEAAQTGALNLEKPENRMQFLEDLGIAGYDEDVSPDVKRAQYENDLIDNLQREPDGLKPVVLMVDDHQLHQELHARRMKEPSFMELPSEVQQAYMQHYEEHQQFIDMAQQEREAAAQAGAATPAPVSAAQPVDDLDARGKGIPADTANALNQADLPPMSKV